jgi:phage-related protein (TIGR01555 family)
MDRAGVDKTAARITAANRMKNYQNAITMDKEDEYDQKQISFGGLSDILLQIRQGIACDVRMPMTKLFGVSAAGFNSGEDDIENYNSMIDSEVRAKSRNIVADMLQIVSQKLFGLQLDDLIVTFKPLRILNANEEEDVKDKKFNRVMSAYNSGLMEAPEAKAALNKDSLLPIEVDENREVSVPRGGLDENTVAGAGGNAGKQTPKEA